MSPHFQIRPSVVLAVLLSLMLTACGGDGAGESAVVVDDPYAIGPYAVEIVELAEGEQGSPKSGLLFLPDHAAVMPVIQFSHGFQGSVENFETLLTHLASYGFIVVAPQLVPGLNDGGSLFSSPTIDEEVADAIAFADWLRGSGIDDRMDFGRAGLVGHSRGGQIVWRALLQRPDLAAAIAGVDPVDGNAPPFSSDTGPLVTAESFAQAAASYTLGTGLGKRGGPLACAPEVRNYTLFYEASASPAWEVLAEDFGHADMEDLNSLEPLACISNPIRADMITFTAGQLVAFFAHALQGASTESYLQSFDTAPIAASGRFK